MSPARQSTDEVPGRLVSALGVFESVGWFNDPSMQCA